MTERVPCRTPNPDKTGVTNVPAWKFDACRAAICTVLARGETPAGEVASRAGAQLTEPQRAELGSLGWHMTTVRLEMEVRGEIERVPGATPLRLRLTG